ncbi:MAG: Fic family protein [Sediminibacterium sp.]
MTKEDIGKIINPQHPWVYGPTTAPTKLLMKNGSVKIGYFQFIENSGDLEKQNKYSFVELSEAQRYRTTGDDLYVTIVNGDDLAGVEYPAINDQDIPLESLIRKINDLQKELSKEGYSMQHLLKVVVKFRLDWGDQLSVSQLDGATIGSTKQILIENLSSKTKKYQDQNAEYSTNKILSVVDRFLKDNVLDEALLFNLHSLIIDSEKRFRDHTVTVYQRIPSDFSFPPPDVLFREIGKLLDWYNHYSNKDDFHPLLLAGIFHYNMVAIHPFADGNGRLARILTSLILLRKKIPPPIITFEDRVFYIDALQKADAGNMETWIKFLGKKLITSMESLLSTNSTAHV